MSALAKVTKENWRKAYERIENVEKFYWAKDGLVDGNYYSFVINLDDTDTDELSGGVESEFEEEENAWIQILSVRDRRDVLDGDLS
ncbi:hypothetical protein ANN_04043 [Periplaneta americana]|uniref:Uncharacterized protein n=1 Tax=Periplaneta americana TaxID=6978 RepID=A0ABQ8T9H1_PERAM|nr:hypothetical protein ANN_04043 [Periplaneta americana]